MNAQELSTAQNGKYAFIMNVDHHVRKLKRSFSKGMPLFIRTGAYVLFCIKRINQLYKILHDQQAVRSCGLTITIDICSCNFIFVQ